MPVSEARLAAWTEQGGFFREKRLARAGLSHGVTHRGLGNMKDPAAREVACRAVGLEPDRLFLGHQVHGAEIVEAAGRPSTSVPKCDGWVTAEKGAVLGVFVADCLPIFLWDDASLEAIGVFHAGWRGVASGMPSAAARAFRRFGVFPNRLAAAVGPHIGACCYRVGPELRARFRPGSLREDGEGLRLDLGAESGAQLVEAGLDPAKITISGDCTSCRREELFSFRREKMDQRMLAFLALPR